MPVGVYKRNVPPLSEYLKKRSVPAASGCIEWIGGISNGGYGLGHHGGIKTTAHRLSYICHKGEVPKGLEIDHLCKNIICINPDHLEAVTRQMNVDRSSIARGTHCSRGHEFNEDNTYTKPSNGARACRKCNARYSREGRKRDPERYRAYDKRKKRTKKTSNRT